MERGVPGSLRPLGPSRIDRARWVNCKGGVESSCRDLQRHRVFFTTPDLGVRLPSVLHCASPFCPRLYPQALSGCNVWEFESSIGPCISLVFTRPSPAYIVWVQSGGIVGSLVVPDLFLTVPGPENGPQGQKAAKTITELRNSNLDQNRRNT